MYLSQFLPKVVELKLSFFLDLVYLLLEAGHLTQQLLAILCMFAGLPLDFSQQFGDFIILDGYDLLEAVKLNGENLALVLQVVLDILNLEIDHLLELLLESIDLLIFLFD